MQHTFTHPLSINLRKRRAPDREVPPALIPRSASMIFMRNAENMPIKMLDAGSIFAAALAPFTLGRFGRAHTINRENPFE